MAFTQGSSAVWTEIRDLYSSLAAIRTTHSLESLSVPSTTPPEKIYASTITTLNESLENARTEAHLASSTPYTTVANPTQGTKIEASLISQIAQNIDGMTNIPHCYYDCDSCNCDCCGFGEGFH